ncbi:hypothetical protein V6R21_16655 [Limibacter armeniacum]|uniref:GumC family protein n=1 Tax=Limibacter armeniacum TaxID=466084 RepID=UPI002FE53EC8
MLYRNILKSLLLRWRVLLVMPMLSAVTVVVVTFFMERKYISNSRLLYNLKNKELSLIDQGIQQYEIQTQFDNIFELLKSRNVVDKVRQRMVLDWLSGYHQYIEFADYEDLKKESVRLKEYIGNLYQNGLLLDARNEYDERIIDLLEDNRLSFKNMMEYISIYRIGTSYFISVSVETEDPAKSTYILELLISELITNTKNIARAKFKAKRIQTEELVDKAKNDLDNAEQALQQFKIGHKIINLDEYTSNIVDQIVATEVKLINLKEAQHTQQKAIGNIEKLIGKNQLLAINNSGNSYLMALKDSLRKVNENIFYNSIEGGKLSEADQRQLESKAKELRDNIAEEMVSMADDSGNPSSRGSAINKDMMGRYVDYKLEMEMNQALLPLVEGQLENMKNYAKDFAPLESGLFTLNRDLKVAQEKYLQLLDKLETSILAEQEAGEEELIVVDMPLPPEQPEKSKRILMVIGAFLGTFVLLILTLTLIEIYEYYKEDLKLLLNS